MLSPVGSKGLNPGAAGTRDSVHPGAELGARLEGLPQLVARLRAAVELADPVLHAGEVPAAPRYAGELDDIEVSAPELTAERERLAHLAASLEVAAPHLEAEAREIAWTDLDDTIAHTAELNDARIALVSRISPAKREVSLQLVLPLQDPARATDAWRAAWRQAERMSLAHSFQYADLDSLAADVADLEDDIAAQRFLAAARTGQRVHLPQSRKERREDIHPRIHANKHESIFY